MCWNIPEGGDGKTILRHCLYDFKLHAVDSVDIVHYTIYILCPKNERIFHTPLNPRNLSAYVIISSSLALSIHTLYFFPPMDQCPFMVRRVLDAPIRAPINAVLHAPYLFYINIYTYIQRSCCSIIFMTLWANPQILDSYHSKIVDARENFVEIYWCISYNNLTKTSLWRKNLVSLIIARCKINMVRRQYSMWRFVKKRFEYIL